MAQSPRRGSGIERVIPATCLRGLNLASRFRRLYTINCYHLTPAATSPMSNSRRGSRNRKVTTNRTILLSGGDFACPSVKLVAPETGAPGLGGLLGVLTAGVLASRFAGCAMSSAGYHRGRCRDRKIGTHVSFFLLKGIDVHKLLSLDESSWDLAREAAEAMASLRKHLPSHYELIFVGSCASGMAGRSELVGGKGLSPYVQICSNWSFAF
jgi:hypothetical protein